MRKTVVAAVVLCALALTGLARGEEALRVKAREVLARTQAAVVTVKLVVTTRWIMQGRESNKSENKSEVSGTVLDPSGLTVLSNTASDPASEMATIDVTMGGEKVDFKVESDVSDLKIVLADGTEVPAQMVLKDKDLDLVFVRPKEKPEQPWPCVSFAAAPAPQVLDDTIVVSRLSRAVNRVPAVATGTISAIVKKPRTFFVTDIASGLMALGCPVFTAKGETLGLLVMRNNPVKGGGGGFGFLAGMQPVVLPSDDLMEVAKQALAAKAEEKK